MTRQTKVMLLCDMEEDGLSAEAEETVAFSVDGTSYEIELCAEHLAEFNEVVEPWTARARPVRGRGRRPVQPAAAVSSRRRRSGGTDLTEVRDWARANGLEVSQRGRVPQRVLDAFAQAHR